MKFSSDLKVLFKERRYDVAILMMAAMFPIHRSFTSVIFMVAFGIVALYENFNSATGKKVSREAVNYFLITTGFFLFMIFGLVYSEDFKKGMNFVIANSYLLIYPFVILLFARDISEQHLRLIMFAFIFACLGLAGYMHWKFFQAGLYTQINQDNYSIFPFRNLLMEIGYHPTYSSMWFLFGSLFLINYVFKNNTSRWFLLIIAFSIVVFLGTSVLMSVKVTTIAFMLTLLVWIYKAVRNKVIVVVSYLTLVAIFTIAVTEISFLRARFVDELTGTQLLPPVGLATNSLNIRVGIYQCSWVVFQNNWLIGTGIGDAQHELNECYDGFDTDVYRGSNYNSHNNYLGIAVATGVVGLALFLLMLIFHLVQSARHNNLEFMVFLVFIMICFVGENILSRHHGVVFYSLFCGLFARRNLQFG